MPVNSFHPLYAEYSSKWSKCRDSFEGSDTVKAKGTTYLPRLSEQSDEEYKAYKLRALFYSITSKTIESLVGLAMQKDAILKYPSDMIKYFEDNSGVEFYELLGRAFSEVMLMGRYGVLIDRPINSGPPQPSAYTCESIINWDADTSGFTMVVLSEQVLLKNATDPFVKEYKTQYRVLELINGIYTQTIYDHELNVVSVIVPTNSGIAMDFIPFYIVTPSGINSPIAKPPMLDIVEINLSHYRTSADLEHGRHFTGLPTPVAIGVDASTTLKVGSMTAWIIPEANGDAKYLEFTGEGLKSLEKALSEKQGQLASLSARLIDNSSRGSESPETVKLRYASENANLVSISRAIEAFMNVIYKSIALMEGMDASEVSIELQRDFVSKALSSKEIKEYVEAYLTGGISKETLVYNLRRGGVIDPLRSDIAELAAIVEPTVIIKEQGNETEGDA